MKAHRSYNVLGLLQFTNHLPVGSDTGQVINLLDSAIMYGDLIVAGELLQEEAIFSNFLKSPYHALELAIINKKDLILDLLLSV
jgi:hypothetical protein